MEKVSYLYVLNQRFHNIHLETTLLGLGAELAGFSERMTSWVVVVTPASFSFEESGSSEGGGLTSLEWDNGRGSSVPFSASMRAWGCPLIS